MGMRGALRGLKSWYGRNRWLLIAPIPKDVNSNNVDSDDVISNDLNSKYIKPKHINPPKRYLHYNIPIP